MSEFKVLIPLSIPRQPFDHFLYDCKLVYPSNDKFTSDEIADHIKGCDAIVSIFGHQLNAQLIESAPLLKIIANYGAGYDNVDIDYATSKNIVVTNCPHPVTEPTAELAMGLMLDLARNITRLNMQLRYEKNVIWGTMQNLSSTLNRKKLGIIGLGAIGKALARRAKAFNMDIVYFSRNRLDFDVENQFGVQWMPFDQLLSESDFVSLNVPLNASTQQLIGKYQLGLMKPTSCLINTSRGAVVDEDALIDALESCSIAGAGLDVFVDEPNIPDRLLNLKNVVLTPHVGSATIETRLEMSFVVASNIRNFIDGKIPPNIVNLSGLKL